MYLQTSKSFPESAELVYVDDEPQNTYLFADVLEDQFNVKTFQEPTRCIDYVTKNPRVLTVVTDQSMPGMKGLDVAKAIKRECPHINIIMLTANPEGDKNLLYSSLRENLFYDFLQKPLNYEERSDEIELLFSKSMTKAFLSYGHRNYLECAELFYQNPITESEFSVCTKFFSKTFNNKLALENYMDSIEVYLASDSSMKPIAKFEKMANSRYIFNLIGNGPKNVLMSKDISDVLNILMNHPSHKETLDFLKKVG